MGPPSPSPTPSPTPYPQVLYLTCYTCNSSGDLFDYNGGAFGTGYTNTQLIAPAYGVAIDDSRNLSGLSSPYPPTLTPVINEYSPALTELAWYAFAPNLPQAVVVGSGSAEVYASNFYDGTTPVRGLVEAYDQNGITFALDFTDRNMDQGSGQTTCLALDTSGDVFIGGESNAGNSEVDMLEAGGTLVNLNLTQYGFPDSLELDTNGNLVVAESGTGIALFPQGENSSPISWIFQGSAPLSVALGNGGNWLYDLDQSNMFAPTINVYTDPQGALIGTYDEVPLDGVRTNRCLSTRTVVQSGRYSAQKPSFQILDRCFCRQGLSRTALSHGLQAVR